MQGSVRRFACTQCGKCCNRAPEVELSEAAALADIFVFRLMFRLYSLPRVFDRSRSDAAEVFYQKKRLLTAHAACVSAKKVKRDGRSIEHLDYLMISALALDTAPGTCAALSSGRCSIYERRPLTCRTVPFHYARAEGLAERDLDAFVSTRGYRCDLGQDAPVVLESGRVVDEGTRQARCDALDLVRRDRPWKHAIVRRMRVSSDACLPTLLDIEANAAFGAMTTSMRVGWEIAAAAGLISERQTHALFEKQSATIGRELDIGRTSEDDRQTLQEMSAEYRHALAG